MDMTEIEIRERLTKTEERAKSNSHRLDKLEPVITEIHTMSENMGVLVEQMKHNNESLKELKEDVEEIKKEPSTRMAQIKTAIITALITAIVSGAVGAIMYFG